MYRQYDVNAIFTSREICDPGRDGAKTVNAVQHAYRPVLKAAAETAAADDRRSLSSLIEIVNGLLPRAGFLEQEQRVASGATIVVIAPPPAKRFRS
jgi:hypothetical protein